jgi:C4-dicarboxylate-binding protein DctP
MKRLISQALFLRVAALVLSCAVSAGAWAQEPIIIRFSHVVSEADPKGIGAELFKQRVEERLAEKVRVEVYPDSQLFTDEQVLLALLTGDVQLAAPSLSKFGDVTPQLQVFDLPFLFESIEAVHRFQASETGRKLLDSMRDKGIQGLDYWDNGLRVISAIRPLRAPADAAGLKFRIEASDVIEAQYRMLDALPVKLSFNQVYDALQSGLVDGQENSWSNIASQQLYKLGQSFTETRHSFLGYMVVTSVKFWDSLPAEVRTELEKILAEVTAEVNRIAREQAASSRQTVIDAGAAVIELSPVEKELWVGQWKQVWERFENRIGTEIVAAAVAANSE